jgi:hypothetical protein
MKSNGSESVHVTFTARRETCFSLHIQNLQHPENKYLGLPLNRRLTWYKHIFTKGKQLGNILVQTANKSRMGLQKTMRNESLFVITLEEAPLYGNSAVMCGVPFIKELRKYLLQIKD